MALIALASLSVPVPLYLIPETRFLTTHNTAWISWSFVVMALPVGIAFAILTTNQRHLGDRADAQLSETQRIFTSSWWTGDGFGDFGGIGTLSEPPARRRDLSGFDPDLASLQLSADGSSDGATAGAAASSSIIPAAARRANAPSRSKRWLPASFVRFIWFCLALSVGLLAYVLGEAYAEIYLDTLPHGNLETIVYVWSWVATVHLLDALTAWILGGSEGERVGSYPLSWIFKLYVYFSPFFFILLCFAFSVGVLFTVHFATFLCASLERHSLLIVLCFACFVVAALYMLYRSPVP